MGTGGMGRTVSVALVGLEGHLVEVESMLTAGLPQVQVIGLPDTSLGEARERVRAAVVASGMTWPMSRLVISLRPASLPKTGSVHDLAIAVAALASAGVITSRQTSSRVHLGELGLDGRVHPVHGILPAVAAAVAHGHPEVVVPAANADEARLVPGAVITPATHLAELAQGYGATGCVVPPLPDARPAVSRVVTPQTPDLADVLGQPEARHALEVAAAGGHHLLMVGPPGAGKTMLAARLPGLLPDLTEAEAVEVTSVHSVAGTFDPAAGLIRRPPFEDPHHTTTQVALVGGGNGTPRPGAVSRAHRGVLLLDEAPEFGQRVLESLRQPLEHGELVISRARGTARFPARFQLVLAANPCPCGRAVGRGIECTCNALALRRYAARLSGPLLDRIDIQLDVGPVTRAQLSCDQAGERTEVVAQRVRRARERQAHRWRERGWRTNAEVPGRVLREATRATDRRALGTVERALERGALTLRGLDRIVRVAWTLADLAGRDGPGQGEIGAALALRTRGRHG
ncbi:YifB family Mg chelatase-like AAA ATPase [Ruania halotolerans]|uniref:YifB family Mg chelatase-like AAA ATPase n=1 Tax=Ruania halotolerans TaxID=2897773 RepID=UPI001E53EDAA|nr:YifB family Mg chelatase-like AAA ATPase [Ruania halotolerans]UFU05205.1 YifB family Mg chelatase-like AAA ATPase [Ruania halotolerans]